MNLLKSLLYFYSFWMRSNRKIWKILLFITILGCYVKRYTKKKPKEKEQTERKSISDTHRPNWMKYMQFLSFLYFCKCQQKKNEEKRFAIKKQQKIVEKRPHTHTQSSIKLVLSVSLYITSYFLVCSTVEQQKKKTYVSMSMCWMFMCLTFISHSFESINLTK